MSLLRFLLLFFYRSPEDCDRLVLDYDPIEVDVVLAVDACVSKFPEHFADPVPLVDDLTLQIRMWAIARGGPDAQVLLRMTDRWIRERKRRGETLGDELRRRTREAAAEAAAKMECDFRETEIYLRSDKPDVNLDCFGDGWRRFLRKPRVG